MKITKKCSGILFCFSSIGLNTLLGVLQLLAIPYLRYKLNASYELSCLIWLAWPVSGLFFDWFSSYYPGFFNNKCACIATILISTLFLIGSAMTFAIVPPMFMNIDSKIPNIIVVASFVAMMVAHSAYDVIVSQYIYQTPYYVLIFRFSYFLGYLFAILLTMFYLDPLEHMLEIFGGAVGVVMFFTIMCLFFADFGTNIVDDNASDDIYKIVEIPNYAYIGFREGVWAIWLFTFVFSISIYSFVPVATDWYASGNSDYSDGLYNAIWTLLWHPLVGVSSGFFTLFLVCATRICRKMGPSYATWMVGLIGVASFTVILFMFAFKVHVVSVTAAFVMAGFGRLIFESCFPIMFLCFLYFKRALIDIKKNPSLFKSRHERESVYNWYNLCFFKGGQIIAFLFTPFAIHYGEYKIQFIIGGAWGCLAFVVLFCSICSCIGKLSEEDERKLVNCYEEHPTVTDAKPKILFRRIAK